MAITGIALALYQLPVEAARAEHKELTVEAIFGSRALQGSQLRAPAWSPDGMLLTFFQAGEQGTELVAWNAKTGDRRALVTTAQLEEMRAGGPQRTSTATGLGRHPAPPYYWSPLGDAILFVSGGNLFLFDVRAGKWTDAYLAAFASASDCRLVAFDGDFQRYPGVEFLHLRP
jgi:Tol biopolymer transport system component